MAFDGVPRGICPENVAQAILSVSEVKSIHHLHIWALSTTEVAMTVHVVVDKTTNIDLVIHDIRHVAIKKGIDHSTIEVETTLCHCESCDVNQ